MNQMRKRLGAGPSSLLAVTIAQARKERGSAGGALEEKHSPLTYGCKEEPNKQGRMEESVWHKSKHLSLT